jgi:hypothetical protein
MRKSLPLGIFSVLVACLWLSACSGVEPAPQDTPTLVLTNSPMPTLTASPTLIPPTATLTPTLPPTPTPTPIYPDEGFGPNNFPANVNPLTGEFISNPSLMKRRPVAVKINIIPRYNRPPWGLSLADIVYDYYHNDGYTRFHAIYYGNGADLVGPIRSARLLDDLLIQSYKSIFAYGSADYRVNGRLFSSDYSNRLVLEGGQTTLCPPTSEIPLCRQDPNGYNFLLGNTKDIHSYIESENVDDSQQNLNGMTFQLEPSGEGKPAEQISIRYSGDSYTRWDYDPTSGRYLRFQDNVYDQGQGEEYVPMIDRSNDQQISAANVIVLVVQHDYFQRPPAEIIEIVLNGTGLAYAYRDGKAYQVNWNRPSSDSVLYLTFPDGSRYPFKPGNTWFQVIGKNSIITQPQEATWRFEFRIP